MVLDTVCVNQATELVNQEHAKVYHHYRNISSLLTSIYVCSRY